MFRIVALTLTAILLASCNQPSQASQPPSLSFADEDECEDAGMSDAFCDSMFPELEDFVEKKKKSKPLVYKKTESKPKSWYKSKATVKTTSKKK
jgi:hypothetical protein